MRQHIERWREKGLIDAATAEALLAESAAHAARARGRRLPALLGMWGAVLLGAGVLMFVSANWQEMSRLLRLMLLLTGLWGVLLGGAVLQRRGHPRFAEGALVLAAVVFGACIWLIAQMYHIEGRTADFFMAWGLGALLIALLLGGQWVMALAMALLGIWGAAPLTLQEAPSWLFLPVWGLSVAIIWRRGWPLAMHVALLALWGWLAALATEYFMWLGISPETFLVAQVVVGAGAFVIGRGLAKDGGRHGGLPGIVSAHGAVIAVLAVMLMQYGVRRGFLPLPFGRGVPGSPFQGILMPMGVVLAIVLVAGNRLRWLSGVDVAALTGAFVAVAFLPMVHDDLLAYWTLAGVVLLLALWLVYSGLSLQRPRLVRIGYGVFMLQVLLLYLSAFGGLLQTSLLFLGGGVLFIVLAVLGLKMRGLLAAKDEEGAA